MVLSLTNMVRAPIYDFQVFMIRNHGMNAVQNARKIMVYVKASNADDAKREAKKKRPEFFPQSARKITV